MQAMVPPAAIRPTVSPLGYFCSSISGPIIFPMAAALATPDPDTAPKNPQAARAVAPRPPGIFRSIILANRMRRGVLPYTIREPAKMNMGMAIILNDLAPLAIRWTIISKGG